jgi:mannan endo-1,4-beta-mannosidase
MRRASFHKLIKSLRADSEKYIYSGKWLAGLIISFFCYAQLSFGQSVVPVDSAEAENGILTGVFVASSSPGYSGTGYVTGFDNDGDKVTVTVSVPEKGLYKIIVRYNGPYGGKTQDIYVNDGYSSPVVFPATGTFTDIDAGSYIFNEGTNTITLLKSWGWMEVDKFTVYTTLKNTYNITPDLVDADADSVTKSLYDFLLSQFGEKIISGQTDSYYNLINTNTGRKPMLRSWDFQSYTEGYAYAWDNNINDHKFGMVDDGSVQEAINWYNNTDHEGIVNFHWHWHSPSGGEAGTNTFYTDLTTFDVTQGVTPGTQEYSDIIRDIDTIGYQLKRLQAAGVPVLWRPLHEAGGGWFWWGAKGPVACKKLYSMLFDRLIYYHELHNLIWIWSTPESDWYPGNDSVDIAGYDSYPGAYNYGIQKSAFDNLHDLVNGEKLIAMTENGPIPDPEDCLTTDAPWLYFMSWSNLVKQQNTGRHLRDVFNHPDVLSFEGDPLSVIETSDNEKAGYLVFPNPSSESLRVEGDSFTRLELIDLNGRIIFSSPGNINTINIHAFENGLYILKIYNNRKVCYYKIIIKD